MIEARSTRDSKVPPAGAPLALDPARVQKEIANRRLSHQKLLIALGFDGVLAPIVSQPDRAAIPEEFREPLRKLKTLPEISLAFLSGRSVRDLQNRVAMQDCFFIGNHGMQVRGPGLTSSDGLAESCRADLVDALSFLNRYTTRLKGILVEDKGLTVAAHWRHATANDRAALKELMNVIVRGHPRLQSFAGEECWGLRARASWNKTDAIQQILAKLKLPPSGLVFVGETHTDADVFEGMKEALTFSVNGPDSVPASFHLDGPQDALQLLHCLIPASSSSHQQQNCHATRTSSAP